MRYLALVTDYDGVIARDGRPSGTALSAIERLRKSGRRAILITGRHLENLRESCPNLSLFDYVVAENGATVYESRTNEETLLAKPPPAEFIERLKELGVDPLEIGRVIVATWLPHQVAVLGAIQEMGLELHIVFNRTAVMVLPAGVNKATGMDRPEFFGQLFPNLQAMRTRTGRPHWIVLDESHHLLPAEWSHLDRALPQNLGETIFVTVHPDHLAPLVLSLVDVIIAVGPAPQTTIQKFADGIGQPLAWPAGLEHQKGKAVVWFPRHAEAPFSIEILPGRSERIRHRRKYAEGNMRYRSFFFRGSGNRHNLKAQNLAVFSQIADGIDEETWLFHLRRGDYSRWFRAGVKDNYLADQAERIEQRQDLQPVETRKLIRSLIEARYTLPE